MTPDGIANVCWLVPGDDAVSPSSLVLILIDIKREKKAAKSILPSPETGSQPGAAENPTLQHLIGGKWQ